MNLIQVGLKSKLVSSGLCGPQYSGHNLFNIWENRAPSALFFKYETSMGARPNAKLGSRMFREFLRKIWLAASGFGYLWQFSILPLCNFWLKISYLKKKWNEEIFKIFVSNVVQYIGIIKKPTISYFFIHIFLPLPISFAHKLSLNLTLTAVKRPGQSTSVSPQCYLDKFKSPIWSERIHIILASLMKKFSK